MRVDLFSPTRRCTNVVKIGNLSIGGNNRVAVQSMCNSKTSDIEGSYNQILSLKNASADLVRLTVPTLSDSKSLLVIHEKSKDLDIPICADIHFNSSLAFDTARFVEKVRVNPGNFAKEGEVDVKFTELLNIAKEHNVAIRVGVNHGSLSKYMMERWGDTPRGMVESAMEFLRIAKRENFRNVVVSLKSSNPRVMVESYRLCVQYMDEEQMHYPLHIGVTEAGEGREGRVRSAVGIGALMSDGYGDTIRVSLTEDPVEEIPVGRVLANYFENTWNSKFIHDNNVTPAFDPLIFRRRCSVLPIVIGQGGDYESVPEFWYKAEEIVDVPSDSSIPIVVSSDSPCWVGSVRFIISSLTAKGIKNPIVLRKNYPDSADSEIIAAAEMGAILIDGLADGVFIEMGGKTVDSALGYAILQAAHLRMTSAEIISCPGCGRTQYDLQAAAKAVKERFSGYSNLKIAVMGCIVNGPGEMADADWGYVGAGGNKVSIYKGHDVVVNKVDQSEALDILEKLVKNG